MTDPWKRAGFYYETTLAYANGRGTLTVSLDFVTYHFVKWYYGESELIKIATRHG